MLLIVATRDNRFAVHESLLLKLSKVVRGGGLEPPHCFQRQDLNLVRLPISPPAHLKTKGTV